MAQVGNKGERMGRVHSNGAEYGEQFGLEFYKQVFPILHGKLFGLDNKNIGRFQITGQVFHALPGDVVELDDGFFYGLKLFRRGHIVRACTCCTFVYLGFETCHPDHEKFIQVGGGNGQKTNTFHQGMVGV